MTEQQKLTLKEINEILGTKYDLIKFDGLNGQELLQILIDLLVSFGAGEKVSVSEEEGEVVSRMVLEMLANVKYRPPAGYDGSEFRRLLLSGDGKVVNSILNWLLANKEHVRNVAYLAKYLKVPEVPVELQRHNTIQDLLDLYQNLVEEFKEVHKRTRRFDKDNSAEIISDIKEMAVERDIVIKRLENVQVNLIDVNEREDLLNASRALRVQQERSKDLEYQFETQQMQLRSASEQLKRYLNVFHGQSAAPKTSADITKNLQEEIQLNEYLVKEKLPQEMSGLQKELAIMQMVAAEQHLTRSDLVMVQDKIGNVNAEIEGLVQQKLVSSAGEEDKLKPFRQQAAVIRRNKEASAERVRELNETLKEQEGTLADLQSQVHQLLGDTILKGEELKKYVNSLRNKSTVYKRQRANLTFLKGESGILERTLQIISNTDPTVEMALVNHKKLKINEEASNNIKEDTSQDLQKKSFHELSQIVAQMAQKLSETRQQIQPLSMNLKPIKAEYLSIQQQYEQKKRVYDATTINLNSQMEPLKTKAQELSDKINQKEEELKSLRMKIAKAETLQEVVTTEMKNSVLSPRKPSKIENLQKKIKELESLVKDLEEEQVRAAEGAGREREQAAWWGSARHLLECARAARRRQLPAHALTLTPNTQTLTLAQTP